MPHAVEDGRRADRRDDGEPCSRSTRHCARAAPCTSSSPVGGGLRRSSSAALCSTRKCRTRCRVVARVAGGDARRAQPVELAGRREGAARRPRGRDHAGTRRGSGRCGTTAPVTSTTTSPVRSSSRCAVATRCGRVLIWPPCWRRRGPALLAAASSSRRRGRRQRRSDAPPVAVAPRRRSVRRASGGAAHPRAGGDLHRLRAEVQRLRLAIWEARVEVPEMGVRATAGALGSGYHGARTGHGVGYGTRTTTGPASDSITCPRDCGTAIDRPSESGEEEAAWRLDG